MSDEYIEVERRWLVDPTDESFLEVAQCYWEIRQGVLPYDLASRVFTRVRVARVGLPYREDWGEDGKVGYLTIKGPGDVESEPVLSRRVEHEWEIDYEEAESILRSLAVDHIQKRRYIVPVVDAKSGFEYGWEVDVFGGENEGLVIAELESTDEAFAWPEPPFRVLREVTDDVRLCNAQLARVPWGKHDDVVALVDAAYEQGGGMSRQEKWDDTKSQRSVVKYLESHGFYGFEKMPYDDAMVFTDDVIRVAVFPAATGNPKFNGRVLVELESCFDKWTKAYDGWRHPTDEAGLMRLAEDLEDIRSHSDFHAQRSNSFLPFLRRVSAGGSL